MNVIVVLALLGLASSASQPRKLFHEHFEDFIQVIMEESGDDLQQLMDEYVQYEEFILSVDYMMTNNFKEIVYEMESLPEFQAVVEFLEKDNIDILFFIELINELLESFSVNRVRQLATGKDVTSYINDSINLFPKDNLSALFDQKMAEDEEFRVAIENLNSDEWRQTFSALWENETFKAEIEILALNGIQASLLVDEIMAIFGQN